MGKPISTLPTKLVAFVKSPQGQKFVKQAVAKAKDPATRAKVQQLAAKAKGKVKKP